MKEFNFFRCPKGYKKIRFPVRTSSARGLGRVLNENDNRYDGSWRYGFVLSKRIHKAWIVCVLQFDIAEIKR
jgi:hypothetical protein